MLQPDKVDQIAALPIGARVKLDLWSDRVELLKAKPVALLSAREEMPFEVTPFMPFLTRYQKRSSGISLILPRLIWRRRINRSHSSNSGPELIRSVSQARRQSYPRRVFVFVAARIARPT